jgi:uncharacterized membrane protein YidH (DUF202 family)
VRPHEEPFPGLATERTALSWQRTSFSMIAVSALVVRWSMVQHLPAWPWIVLTALVALGSLVLVGRRYRRMCNSVRAGQTPRSRYLVSAAAGFTVALVIGVGAGILVEYTTF